MTTNPRKLWIASAVAAGLAAAAIPTAWASADAARQPAVAASAHALKTVSTVQWTITAAHKVDIPPKGLSSGDTLQARFTFTGKTKGSADFACTAVTTHYLCQGIIRLRDGDLYVTTGPVDGDQPAAVEGGTRAYAGARGQFTQVEKPDGTGSWTIALLP